MKTKHQKTIGTPTCCRCAALGESNQQFVDSRCQFGHVSIVRTNKATILLLPIASAAAVHDARRHGTGLTPRDGDGDSGAGTDSASATCASVDCKNRARCAGMTRRCRRYVGYRWRRRRNRNCSRCAVCNRRCDSNYLCCCRRACCVLMWWSAIGDVVVTVSCDRLGVGCSVPHPSIPLVYLDLVVRYSPSFFSRFRGRSICSIIARSDATMKDWIEKEYSL